MFKKILTKTITFGTFGIMMCPEAMNLPKKKELSILMMRIITITRWF
jgi:hypothetical protein